MNAPFSDEQLQALNAVKLDDKYDLAAGRAWLSGIHALVRLPMNQRVRDQRDGLNTAGFISGYRGSPLGGLDQNLWKAAVHLKEHHVVFQPGVNEDLAATSIWGSQQVNMLNKQVVRKSLQQVNGKKIRPTLHAITSIIRHPIPHSFRYFVGRNSDSVFRHNNNPPSISKADHTVQ